MMLFMPTIKRSELTTIIGKAAGLERLSPSETASLLKVAETANRVLYGQVEWQDHKCPAHAAGLWRPLTSMNVFRFSIRYDSMMYKALNTKYGEEQWIVEIIDG